MELTIEVTTTQSDLYDYRLNRRYTSLQGILITMTGILIAGNAIIEENLVISAIGFCLILFVPFIEFYILKKQLIQNSYRIKPVQYHMDEQGIKCTYINKKTESVMWEQVVKAGSTRSIFFLECKDGKTIILPRREVMNYLGEVIGMISKNISPEKVRIRL